MLPTMILSADPHWILSQWGAFTPVTCRNAVVELSYLAADQGY